MVNRIRTKYALVGSDLDLIENVDVLINNKNEIIEIEELSQNITSNTLTFLYGSARAKYSPDFIGVNIPPLIP